MSACPAYRATDYAAGPAFSDAWGVLTASPLLAARGHNALVVLWTYALAFLDVLCAAYNRLAGAAGFALAEREPAAKLVRDWDCAVAHTGSLTYTILAVVLCGVLAEALWPVYLRVRLTLSAKTDAWMA